MSQIYLRILAVEDSDSILANNQSAKRGPSVLTSVCNHLLSTLEIVHHVWSDRFIEFLCRVSDLEGNNIQRNKVIIHLADQLKEIALKFLSGRSPVYKEVSNILQVIIFLINTLDKTQEDFSQRAQHTAAWLNELAKDRPIEDPALVKEIVSLLINMAAGSDEQHIIHNICEDIHAFVGEIETGFNEDEEQERPDIQYQIINAKTYGVITSQVFEYLDSSFDEITWCVGKLRLCGKFLLVAPPLFFFGPTN